MIEMTTAVHCGYYDTGNQLRRRTSRGRARSSFGKGIDARGQRRGNSLTTHDFVDEVLGGPEVGMIEVEGRLGTSAWNCSQAEKIADGFIHVIGLALAICGGGTLVVLASRSASWSTIATVGVYATSLVVALAFSTAYNMSPVSGTKCLLRRFDQAAIFLLIGGTYAAFLAQAGSDPASLFLLVALCAVAAIGALLKLVLPGRSDRLSLAAYLALGWSGLVLFPTAIRVLPITAVCLIALGGLLYTVGVIFHMWKRLRFQNAIWHAFVLLAAGCHYGAVLDCLVFART